jgi:DNA-binding LacI/PurR family transcriptional regulator
MGNVEVPKLKDVAKAAGVSVATASSALNGTGRVAKPTIVKVKNAARQLGYRPNALARSLRFGETNAIGLYHISMDTLFYTYYIEQFVFGTLKCAHAHSYDLTLLSNNRLQQESVLPRVDGLIVTDPIDEDAKTINLFKSGLPIIAGERFTATSSYQAPIVGINHVKALQDVFSRANQLKCHSPSLICPDPHTSGWGELIAAEFKRWCSSINVRPHIRYVPFSKETRPIVSTAVEELLSENPHPDFFLTTSSAQVTELLARLDKGRNMEGKTCHIASCSDSPEYLASTPQITAIDLRPFDLGWLAGELLFELMGGGNPKDFILQGDVTFRGTMSLKNTPSS